MKVCKQVCYIYLDYYLGVASMKVCKQVGLQLYQLHIAKFQLSDLN